MLDLGYKKQERAYALDVLFKNVSDKTFQHALRHKCYEDIAKAAPPEAIEIVLAMESIPPHWGYWILHYHSDSLTITQVQQLVTTIATSAGLSYHTLRDCHEFLTPEQRQQLVNTIAKNINLVYHTFRDCSEFLTTEQRQQLIDKIATDLEFAYSTLHYCSYLTPAQRKQLGDPDPSLA